MFLKEFFEKVDFEQNQMTKKPEKLPRMLKVQTLLITENSVDSSETFACDYFIGYYIIYYGLTLFILDTSKQVLWQTVKSQMKCRLRQHFIRVCTVFADKNILLGQKYIILKKF